MKRFLWQLMLDVRCKRLNMLQHLYTSALFREIEENVMDVLKVSFYSVKGNRRTSKKTRYVLPFPSCWVVWGTSFFADPILNTRMSREDKWKQMTLNVFSPPCSLRLTTPYEEKRQMFFRLNVDPWSRWRRTKNPFIGDFCLDSFLDLSTPVKEPM